MQMFNSQKHHLFLKSMSVPVLLLSMILLYLGCSGSAKQLKTKKSEHAGNVHIIPQPLLVEKKSGQFAVSGRTVILVDPLNKDFIQVAEYLQHVFRPASGITLPIVNEIEENQSYIWMKKSKVNNLSKEG